MGMRAIMAMMARPWPGLIARIAAEEAVASPLLDDISLDGARGVLVNISTVWAACCCANTMKSWKSSATTPTPTPK